MVVACTRGQCLTRALHGRKRRNYVIPARYARHATDSNPVKRSPLALAFLTYFRYLTFPGEIARSERACHRKSRTSALARSIPAEPRADWNRETMKIPPIYLHILKSVRLLLFINGLCNCAEKLLHYSSIIPEIRPRDILQRVGIEISWSQEFTRRYPISCNSTLLIGDWKSFDSACVSLVRQERDRDIVTRLRWAKQIRDLERVNPKVTVVGSLTGHY